MNDQDYIKMFELTDEEKQDLIDRLSNDVTFDDESQYDTEGV